MLVGAGSLASLRPGHTDGGRQKREVLGLLPGSEETSEEQRPHQGQRSHALRTEIEVLFDGEAVDAASVGLFRGHGGAEERERTMAEQQSAAAFVPQFSVSQQKWDTFGPARSLTAVGSSRPPPLPSWLLATRACEELSMITGDGCP